MKKQTMLKLKIFLLETLWRATWQYVGKFKDAQTLKSTYS